MDLEQSPYTVNLIRSRQSLLDALLKADNLMQKHKGIFSSQELQDLADIKYQLACQAGKASVDLQFSKRKIA